MKRNLLFVLLALLSLAACSKNATTVESAGAATLVCYCKSDNPTEAGPILMYEHNNSVLAQYYDPEWGDNVIYLFHDAETGKELIMLSDENSILFIPADATLNHIESAAITFDYDTPYLMYGDFNAKTGSFIPEKWIPIEVETVLTKRGYNFGDSIRRSALNDFVLKFKDANFFKGCDSFLPANMRPGTMMTYIMQTITLAGMNVLMQTAGEDLQGEIREKQVEVATEFFIEDFVDAATNGLAGVSKGKTKLLVSMLSFANPAGIAVQTYRYIKKAATGAFPSDDLEVTTGSSLLTSNVVGQSRRLSPGLSTMAVKMPESESPFILSFNVSNITKTSATFSGSSSAGSGYGHAADVVLEQGFKYTEKRSGTTHYVQSSGLGSKTVDLKPATAYSAVAYIRTLSGKDWYSKAVDFISRGALLELSPYNSFGFTLEGGEKETGVTVGDGASLKITNPLPWCKVNYSDGVLTVSVKKSMIERSGSFTLETTSPYGETESISVPVNQFSMLEWDGTSWHFEEVTNSSYKNSYDLTIISVAAKDFYFGTGEGDVKEKEEKEIGIDDKGNLNIMIANYYKYKMNYGYGYIYMYYKSTHCLERIDENTAKSHVVWENGGSNTGYLKTSEGEGDYVGTRTN